MACSSMRLAMAPGALMKPQMRVCMMMVPSLIWAKAQSQLPVWSV